MQKPTCHDITLEKLQSIASLNGLRPSTTATETQLYDQLSPTQSKPVHVCSNKSKQVTRMVVKAFDDYQFNYSNFAYINGDRVYGIP
jgi:hypothetical protein